MRIFLRINEHGCVSCLETGYGKPSLTPTGDWINPNESLKGNGDVVRGIHFADFDGEPVYARLHRDCLELECSGFTKHYGRSVMILPREITNWNKLGTAWKAS